MSQGTKYSLAGNVGLGARLFEFRRHQDPRVANESKLKFDRTAVLYVKYVVDTFLFLIISFQMVEALLEEAQEDITPEVGVRSHFGR